MRFSRFGEKMGPEAGIVRLMDDLGDALALGPDLAMLGGGNPGVIPEMNALFRERMARILDTPGAFERLIGVYDSPRGNQAFATALAALLRREYGWQVGPGNIALTNGSQSASFMLFNLFGGPRDDGSTGRILLPLAPEYIGYADQGLAPGLFSARRPHLEMRDGRFFKYRVDLDGLEPGPEIAAICASRPTNPTGNVLTDDEVAALRALARERDVPLILDAAYGTPFPGIVFAQATPVWDEHVVLCMSLSKLGLPGVRTGIVVANEAVIRALSGINAIVNLSTGALGPMLVQDMVESGDILRVSRDVVAPYYRRRVDEVVALIARELDGVEYRLHQPEGAIFVWLWLPELPITSEALYQRLKRRGVLVLSGHHFFPGLEGEWAHTHQCLRINYSQDPASVARGIRILGDELRALG